MKYIVFLLPLFVSLFLVGCGSHAQSTANQTDGPVAPESTPAPAPVPTPAPHVHVDKHEAFMLETPNLERYRRTEVASMTPDQVTERNDADIAAFTAFIPEAHVAKTGGEIEEALADKVLAGITENPVVSPYNEQYQKPGVRIGYCFGRATYVHLALKKVGLQTSAIRKLWLIGPMTAGSVDWAFHVATAAFVKGQGWMVIDSNLSRNVNVRDWFDHYSYMSTDKKLRVYFTTPERFGVTIPKYDRVDLGLTLPAERDWYSHYFVDLMAWFRKADFKALGFDRVAPATVARAPSATATDDIYSSRN